MKPIYQVREFNGILADARSLEGMMGGDILPPASPPHGQGDSMPSPVGEQNALERRARPFRSRSDEMAKFTPASISASLV